jgi:uncharacterized membrane protein YgcG
MKLICTPPGWVLGVAAVGAMFIAPVAAMPTDVLARNARGATVLIRNLEGRKSIGTGFFIYPDLLVTNKHVLEALEVEIVDEQGRTQIGRCVAEAKDDDLALVRAMTSSGYLSLRPSEPKYGEKVLIMGNPRGLQYTLSDGIVSHPVKKYPQGELFQHSAPQSPGSSGSAVLDSGGRVIGVVCSQITDSQNLNFAVPASRLKDLIQKWRLGMDRPQKKRPTPPPESCKPGSGGGGGIGRGGGGGIGPGGGGGVGIGGGGGGEGGSCPPKDPEEEYKDLLAKARALFKKGELEAAGAIYEEIIRKYPERPEALVGIGAVLAAQKKFPEALEAYDEAERVAPGDPRVNLERAKCRVRAGQMAEALDDFKKAVVKNPSLESAWQGAAELLQKKGRQDEAADLWSEGLRKNPQWGEKDSSPSVDPR